MQNPYQYDFQIPQPLQVPNSPFGGAAPQPGMGIAPLAPPPQAGQGNDNMSAAEKARLAALLGTYGDQLELDNLEKQMAQAEALRQAMPEGRDNGRVYTAANPLEFIGKGIGDYKLMKKRQETEAAAAPIRTRIGTNAKTYGDFILKDL